jgi:hypothetical protein
VGISDDERPAQVRKNGNALIRFGGTRLEGTMKSSRLLATIITLGALGVVVQHSPPAGKAGRVPEGIRQSLDEAGLSAVNVIEDNRGMLVLTGRVLTEDDRYLAQTIAKSAATGGQTVFDEVSVLLPGPEMARRGE